MDNIINGLEYQLETGSDVQEEEDYEEDDFENYQDKSDDEQTLETLKNSQRNTMKQSLFDVRNDNIRVKSSTTPLAKAIERYAKEIANARGYPKTNNRNLGNGWTEWYGTPEHPITQEQIWSCIMSATWELKKAMLKKGENNDS